MGSSIDDPRMVGPQCFSLQPVTILYENPWFSLKNRGGYYVIESNYSQVAILPIVDEHSIVMVRVKRPVMADSPLELPAGSAEESESPVGAAVRELWEETGIRINNPNRFRLLSPIAISSTRCPVMDRVYQIDITANEFNKRIPHDDEIESVEIIPFVDVKTKIIQGGIYVSLSIAIISRFLFLQERGLWN